MKLTDTIIKATKPKDKDYSLADGHGLILLIKSSGAKWWRYRYRHAGKAKMISIGVYPDVTLKTARGEHGRFRELLTQGVDPSQYRQEQKQQAKQSLTNNFESVTKAWWNHWRKGQTEKYARSTIRRMEADVFPVIGNKPINEVTAAMLINVIKKVEFRGSSDIAKRALTTCGQVFRYAIVHGLAERNTATDIRSVDVLNPRKVKNFARVSEQELPKLLQQIDGYKWHPLTRLALQLMALTFVRTGELLGARWDEVDIDKKLWRISAERMKMRAPHIVPLSRQAIAIIEEIRSMGLNEILLFPSEKGNGKTMNVNTILHALYRLGYHSLMTGHGFRGLASTILHEHQYNHDHIELQLAHSKRDAVSASYNHALYLEPRARMMQDWADYLDGIKAGASILPFKTA